MSGRRVFALYALLLGGFFVVVCRLYLISSNTAYAARSQSQSTVALALPARRGNFYDCDGLPLTGLSQRWYALCLPRSDSYARLYDETDPAGQALLYRSRNAAAPFLVQVGRDLSALGVSCYPDPRRYCTVPLCQHLIGYLDGEGRGVAGLESALDGLLSGTGAHSEVRCCITAQGTLRSGTQPQLVEADSGAVGVRLTISRPVQRAAEAVAAQTMTTGCILVLDTATAKVRACVSLPGYDPEKISASLDAADSPLLNRALCAYAVGSVFKPVLAAAALEQGRADFVYDCPGYTTVDGQVFRCAGGVAHGEMDLAGALEKSCNGYFIHLGQLLGAEKVLESARRLGFGETVQVAGSLYAAAGHLPEAQDLENSGAFANFCFGQGTLLASPVQVAGMMNTIAAGGVYRTPTFVECTLDETTGEELEALVSLSRRRVLAEKTASALQDLLGGVVAEGTGQEAAPHEGDAAGKTGTAQTGQFTAEGEELKNLWFAGGYPAKSPRYTIVVLQDTQTEPNFSSAAVFAQLCDMLAAQADDLEM
ncbi:MAG: peptidoglycan D,D-transpeptidase FtsI family protein [Faecalibacterium sp.]